MESFMIKTNVLPAAVALVLATVAAPAAAEEFRGFYFGVHAGNMSAENDQLERLEFDTDQDGDYDDVVNTPTTSNVFSQGFCGGGPNGPYIQAGCRNNMDDDAGDTGARIGYDWQELDLVYGVLLETSSGGTTDNVSGFTNALESYTFYREVNRISSLRARVGFTFGDGTTVIYGTAGYAMAKVEHDFATTNTVNTFVPVDSNETDARGPVIGFGIETFVWKNFTVGFEYLSFDLSDDGYAVRATGPAPADNPFLIDSPDGTSMRRTNNDIEASSMRMTFNARFPGW
jgi:outer membrane immunogenic protein